MQCLGGLATLKYFLVLFSTIRLRPMDGGKNINEKMMFVDKVKSRFQRKLTLFDRESRKRHYGELHIAATCLPSFSSPWQRLICHVFCIQGSLSFTKFYPFNSASA